ncbi:MAG: hypothetical protein ACOVP2_05985 [Armatimonadaceae bacterium]
MYVVGGLMTSWKRIYVERMRSLVSQRFATKDASVQVITQPPTDHALYFSPLRTAFTFHYAYSIESIGCLTAGLGTETRITIHKNGAEIVSAKDLKIQSEFSFDNDHAWRWIALKNAIDVVSGDTLVVEIQSNFVFGAPGAESCLDGVTFTGSFRADGLPFREADRAFANLRVHMTQGLVATS